jgi:hypothetical protein
VKVLSLEVDDKFEKARKEAEAKKAKEDKIRAFGGAMLKIVEEKMDKPVTVDVNESSCLEYRFYVEPDRRGFLGRLRWPIQIMRVADYRADGAHDHDFHIVVPGPDLRPAAEHLAAWLTLVHGAEKIKLSVTDDWIAL